MATTFTTTHFHQPALAKQARIRKSGKIQTFFADLFEDLREKPLQPAHLAKHDMFHEHINVMSICYFTLILLVIAVSIPVLAYMISWAAL